MSMNFEVFVGFTVIVKISAEQCTTPNNEIAECVSLYSCSTIVKAIATQNPVSTEFARLSNCGGRGNNPLVCCGSSSNFTLPREIVPKESINPSNSSDLSPDKRYCGYQHSDEYFRPGSKKAGINTFPWLALLLFKDVHGNFIPFKIGCFGSLITARYILTAAHCIVETRQHHFYLSGIRLGDFDLDRKIDYEDGLDIQKRSDTIQDFDIEETVVHPNYVPSPKDINDIALIKLNRTVAYSDYIRPIYLPLPGTVFTEGGQVNGWGIVDVQLNITEAQCCTQNTESVYSADSGGPLIFLQKLQWYQEGINTFRAVPCGDLPVIYTKISKYIDWIQKNVKSY